ncbi:hypothetical protein Drose_04330 [Dactylosporangium roseum]|uniref:Uncharacterized protein n=1 Tax=Dactylosporangium roseum TaxID=47989 RepID=A0ABY5Z6N2_9ACTN|nr:hypothetical protein [Dactylosporangium roseum]UWZ37517.1 hypothetical protein Drose_04330 [Dactylosporangium roseum]
MTDILNQIDATLADVSSCAYCHIDLSADDPSGDFCGEICQQNWTAQRLRGKSGIEKGWQPIKARPRPLRLSAETYRALYGDPEPVSPPVDELLDPSPDAQQPGTEAGLEAGRPGRVPAATSERTPWWKRWFR